MESIYIPIKGEDSNRSPYPQGDKPMKTESLMPSTFNSIFNLRPAFTTAGNYELVIKLSKPIYSYHKARPGTVGKFQGKLREIFPELSKISEEELEKISRKREPFD